MNAFYASNDGINFKASFYVTMKHMYVMRKSECQNDRVLSDRCMKQTKSKIKLGNRAMDAIWVR